MPSLEKLYAKKVILPSTKDTDDPAWILISSKVTVGAWTAITENKDKETAGIEGMVSMITDWNLEDKDGKKLPINMENMKMLSVEDAAHLAEKAGLTKQEKSEVSKEEKKS